MYIKTEKNIHPNINQTEYIPYSVHLLKSNVKKLKSNKTPKKQMELTKIILPIKVCFLNLIQSILDFFFFCSGELIETNYPVSENIINFCFLVVLEESGEARRKTDCYQRCREGNKIYYTILFERTEEVTITIQSAVKKATTEQEQAQVWPSLL